MPIGIIVEGHGDVPSVPILLRRLAPRVGCPGGVEVRRPFRLPRGRIPKEPELKRAVELVARSVGEGDPILILFDADTDCPAKLGPKILAWARESRGDREHSVVLARQEFEAWFLGGLSGLRGLRGIPMDAQAPDGDIEELKSPKAWFDRTMPSGYSETIDQPALTSRFDLDEARTVCSSFDKLWRDLERILGATST